MFELQLTTDRTINVTLRDSSTGEPKTSITVTTLTLCYSREREAAVTASLSALTTATDAHADNSAIEIDSVNAPGVYRVDLPDAVFAAGSKSAKIIITGSGVERFEVDFDLVDANVDSTGGILTVNKSLEALVAVLAGQSAGSDPSGIVNYKGRDGSTTIVSNELSGPGVRTASTIS